MEELKKTKKEQLDLALDEARRACNKALKVYLKVYDEAWRAYYEVI